MTISKNDNDTITRVDNDAPLGRMLRQHYWFPVVPSLALEAGDAPIAVTLAGRDYVVYRNGNGAVGVMDEACPHRGASLALAANEEDGLRCIFHGWKFSTSGALLEAPNHAGDEARFCSSIQSSQYAVREVAGIIWAWFGTGEAPTFPDLPFTHLPPEHHAVTSVEVPTNWLQGVEATMDTTHAGSLHQSHVALASGNNQRMNMVKSAKPRFEFEDQPYGFRYAAIRDMPDGTLYARVNNFVMPWYGIITAPEPKGPSTVFFSVPLTDTTHRAWFVHFNLHAPLGMTNLSVSPDVMNYPPLPPGDKKNNWGQNRSLMRRGYFSGFPQHFATEDFAIFLSQGPRLDRSREQLCSSDRALVKLRGQLLKTIQEHERGEAPELPRHPELRYDNIISVGGVYNPDQHWRVLITDEQDKQS